MKSDEWGDLESGVGLDLEVWKVETWVRMKSSGGRMCGGGRVGYRGGAGRSGPYANIVIFINKTFANSL